MSENEGITQEELVNELNRRGYSKVTARQVIDWRSRELLPPFDIQGAGRGRSMGGRDCSRWLNAEHIIGRSIWILHLLNLYGYYSDVYIPLWLLGYSVQIDRVRQSLAEPLKRVVSSVEKDCTAEKNIEDVLGDIAYDLIAKLKNEEVPISDVPQEAVDLALNLFINANYDFTDKGAFKSLRSWLRLCEQYQASLREPGSAQVSSPASPISTMISQAKLIREHLSVAEIKRAVDESKDEDLLVVERDLHSVRLIARMFAKLLSSELASNVELPRDLIWRFVFGLGRIVICLDLSFRKHGRGSDIDALVTDLLAKVQNAFDTKFNEAKATSAAAG